MSLLNRILGKPSGSVFAKISGADDKLAEARGRITAIDAATAKQHQDAAYLEGEAKRVHGDSDAVHSRLDSLLDTL